MQRKQLFWKHISAIVSLLFLAPPTMRISLKLHSSSVLQNTKKLPNFSEVFLFLMLSFLEFEDDMLSEFLVVLSEFEFFSCCEVLLLYIGNVPHDS